MRWFSGLKSGMLNDVDAPFHCGALKLGRVALLPAP